MIYLERRLRDGWADLPRRPAFLSRGRVPLDYGEADLAKDVASIRTARGR